MIENIILYIRQIMKRPDYKTPLGRWHMEKCNKKIKFKIDRANEDHCGPCGKQSNISDTNYNYKNKNN